MDASLVGTLGQIAGIGGISLGVILILFRDIIRKNIFPKFTDEVLAYRLLRLVAVLARSAAIVGIGAWVTTSVLADTDSIRIGSDNYQIENTQNIVNEFQQFVGRPLDDEELLGRIGRAVELAASQRFEEATAMFQKIAAEADLPAVHNNVGALLAVQGDAEGARAAFERAGQVDPDYQTAHFNLGVLAEQDGRLDDALREFEQAPDIAEAQATAEEIEEQQETGTFTREVEPNSDTFTATSIAIDSAVQGSITDGNDVDYVIFTTPPTHRDYIDISLENHSTTWRPWLRLLNADKTDISGEQFNDTSGANLRYTFTAEPDATYFVHLSKRGTTRGDYQLTVSEQ